MFHRFHTKKRYRAGSRGELQELEFDQGKRNFVRVSGEFELSEFELSKLKRPKSRVKSSENGTLFELARNSSYTSLSCRSPKELNASEEFACKQLYHSFLSNNCMSVPKRVINFKNDKK